MPEDAHEDLYFRTVNTVLTILTDIFTVHNYKEQPRYNTETTPLSAVLDLC